MLLFLRLPRRVGAKSFQTLCKENNASDAYERAKHGNPNRSGLAKQQKRNDIKVELNPCIVLMGIAAINNSFR